MEASRRHQIDSMVAAREASDYALQLFTKKREKGIRLYCDHHRTKAYQSDAMQKGSREG
jgi:hypothetical protein